MFDYAIIGAGLAGLTAAWKLHQLSPGKKIVIIERKKIGGMCCSVESENVYFDIGGHFCHNFDILPDFFKGYLPRCTNYQKNTYSFDVQWNCYHGMIQNFLTVEPDPCADYSNLEKYLLSRFGKTIYYAFLKDYNQKLNALPLAQCGVMQFASDRTPNQGARSYNSYFGYPMTGGIEDLVQWLWHDISKYVTIIFDHAVNVDLITKRISLRNTGEINYSSAVFNSSSIADAMGYSSISPTVYEINGFAKINERFENIYDPAWTYISSPETPVFRIGNYNICGAKCNDYVPFYLESSQVVTEKHLSMFFSSFRVASQFVVPNAYPVTKIGADVKKKEKICLDASNNCYWIGRYGKDEWFSMSDTILDTINVVDSYWIKHSI